MRTPSARVSLSVSLAFAFVAAAPSYAATISYGDFSAPSVYFIDVVEGSVTDPLPMYGPPTVTGDTLSYTPSFVSSSSNGTPDTTSGTLQVRILAKTGMELTGLTFSELFDIRFDGAGNPGSTVGFINGLVLLQDMTPGRPVAVLDPLTLSMEGGNLFAPPPAGQTLSRSATAQADLRGMGITNVLVTLNNNLQTLSAAGWTAEIRKTGASLEVTTQREIGTPEPASMGLLGLGALVFLRRQR